MNLCDRALTLNWLEILWWGPWWLSALLPLMSFVCLRRHWSFPMMSSILPSTVLRLSDDLNVASLAYAPWNCLVVLREDNSIECWTVGLLIFTTKSVSLWGALCILLLYLTIDFRLGVSAATVVLTQSADDFDPESGVFAPINCKKVEIWEFLVLL